MVEMKMTNGDCLRGEIITNDNNGNFHRIALNNPQFLILKSERGKEWLVNQENILFISEVN